MTASASSSSSSAPSHSPFPTQDTLQLASSSSSSLFLPPPGPPNPPCFLSSTQDLLSRLQLLPVYDKYVRPAYASTSHGTAQEDHPSESPSPDKGKAKQDPQSSANNDPDDDDQEKGEKKKKNTYKHLIKAMPGKHSMKKDDYLVSMMQIPPKDRVRIRHFDPHTQAEAFSVTLDGLKGWNVNTLILESAQAREDRKKRRELKKLARSAQSAAATVQPQPHPTPSASASTPKPSIPTPGSARPSTVGTPRPSVSHPPAAVTQQQQQQINSPRVATPVRTSTPAATSAAPTHRTSTPTQPFQAPPVIVAVPSTAPTIPDVSRGVKRDRDEPKAIIGAKAGVPGIRPRPVKKQRMDVQGTSLPVQQPTPTPQGV